MLRSAGRVAAVALLALFALGCVSAAAKPSTDRLVAAIKSKNLSAVVDALSVKGLDVNTPDSTRRLPLVEAARSRDARLGGSAAIVKLLLAHGADPNAKDKTGASARSTAAAVKELADLLKQWDARGAMAFEDEPGAWIREERDGQSYYWKPANGESRWAVPPSCAWQRVTVQGHPIKYINSLTGQETTRVPPALAWARVTAADGSALWLNWASRVASAAATAPAELPAELAAELSMHPNRRWYNTATREYVYTDPAYATPWRELVDEASGAPFFFNVETGDTTWELPAALAWTEVIESSSGADGESGSGSEAGPRYFHNTVSGEVAWSAPEGSRHVFVEASAADL
nr:Zys 3 [Chlamydomonas reinhardtii]